MKLDKAQLKKRILPTILISAVLPLIVLLSVPFEIFANNYSEFYFSFSDFFFSGIGFFFLFTAVFFSILFFLPKKAYRIVSSILIALSFLIFFQGTFLNGKMNSLGGDNVDGSTLYSTVAVVFDAIFWVVVIAGFIVLAILKDKKGIISIGAIVLSFIVVGTQIITPVSLSISKKEMFVSATERMKLEDKESEHYTLSTKNLNTVSTSSNIYYFVIDRFDESYAEETYQASPETFANLTGFTWYQDNISIYGHTYPSVANMLTNYDFPTGSFRRDYLNKAYKENNTLDVLHENGYDINLYTQTYYAYTDAYYLPSYVSNREKPIDYKIKDKAGLYFSIVYTALYRGLPLFAKNLFPIDSSTSNGYVSEITESGNKTYSLNNGDITSQFVEQVYDTTDNKQFNFIHIDGCHAAYYTAGSSIRYVVKSFEMVNKYIDVLKEKGLYEDSTIIITGDHGCTVKYNRSDIAEPTLTALFFKPAGTNSEELQISKAQTSHSNIWATILKYAKTDDGTKIDYSSYGKALDDITEGEIQTRYFAWHTWGCALAEYYYKIEGEGKNFANWTKYDEKHYNKVLMD